MKNLKFTYFTFIFPWSPEQSIKCTNSHFTWDFQGPSLPTGRLSLKLLISWYFFLKNRSAIFSWQVDVRLHSVNTEAHETGSWTRHYGVQEGDRDRKPDTELRLWRKENRSYNRECQRTWKNWGGKYSEQLKEELTQENWSGTREHTESLAIRLHQRRKVSSCTTGTGGFKTRKHAAKQFPPGFSTGTMGPGDRAKGRLGRTSLGRRGAELGTGKGQQEQSRAEPAGGSSSGHLQQPTGTVMVGSAWPGKLPPAVPCLAL